MEFQRVNRKIPQVPIIPLIDILAILLIYFAVTTVTKTERHTMSLQLATAQDSMVIKVSGTRSVLAIDANGNIMLDATRVHDDMLVRYLTMFKQQFPNRKLEMEPDERLQIKDFIKVQQALIAAGFDPSKVLSRVKTSARSEDNE